MTVEGKIRGRQFEATMESQEMHEYEELRHQELGIPQLPDHDCGNDEGRFLDYNNYHQQEENERPTVVHLHPYSKPQRRSRRNNNSNNILVDNLEVLRRIEQVAHKILLDLEQEDGFLPRIQRIQRINNNEDYDDDDDDDDDGSSSYSSGRGHDSNDDNRGSSGYKNKNMAHIQKEFNLQQSRSMTNILMVLSYCHNLLLQGKTTTVREVYYYFVTHFRHQKECDAAIQEAALLLDVPRHALGLKASPKGWYCGDLQITTTISPSGQETVSDARAFTSLHGAPIDSTWVHLCQQLDIENGNNEFAGPTQLNGRNFQVSTTASQCILVVEKEGIYNRLAEDRFYDVFPCIIMTAKGFPDLASRAMVYYLHKKLGLPVWGLCDCNPFGVLVLHTYFRGSNRRGPVDGGARFGVPIEYLGLRPPQVEAIKQAAQEQGQAFPSQVFQELTPLDMKRLEDTLMGDYGFEWTSINERRLEELELMRDNGYKMELEALHWLGMDFFNNWLGSVFAHRQAQQEVGLKNGRYEEEGSADKDPSKLQKDVRNIV